MEQSSRTQISLRIPPITRARSTTTSTQYTLIHPIQILPILFTLIILLARLGRRVLPLEPGLNTLILVIEISHVHHQILDHEHVGQGGDHGGGCILCVWLNLGQASEAVAAVDVHGAGAADALAARAAEGQGWVDFVLDLD